MKYAIAYLRVSTDEQTVLTQKIAIDKWAKEHGLSRVYFTILSNLVNLEGSLFVGKLLILYLLLYYLYFFSSI